MLFVDFDVINRGREYEDEKDAPPPNVLVQRKKGLVPLRNAMDGVCRRFNWQEFDSQPVDGTP